MCQCAAFKASEKKVWKLLFSVVSFTQLLHFILLKILPHPSAPSTANIKTPPINDVWHVLKLINYWYCFTSIWRSEDRASWYVLIIKRTRSTNSQIYFCNRTLHISDSSSVHHQESSTVHTAIGVCHTGYADCLLAGSGCRVHTRQSSTQNNK